MLNLKWERGPKGDRYQATISLDPDKVKVGSYNGLLLADTNDLAHPKLSVPISTLEVPIAVPGEVARASRAVLKPSNFIAGCVSLKNRGEWLSPSSVG